MTTESDKLLDVCCNVVVRFKAHDSYKTEMRALAALRRRAPGFDQEQYANAFELLCQVYDCAVDFVPRNKRANPDKTSPFAEFADIDYAACLIELDKVQPGIAVRQKEVILTWVIYWHHLR